MKHGSAHRVSVVMCTYNGAAFLSQQLGSILNQTFPLFEIVVVDDASTDDTAALVRSFAQKNPVIRFYQNERNLGYNKNFEQALRLATGNIIALADQDDIWHPRKIEVLLDRWDFHYPLIYCNSALFYNDDPATAQPNSLMRRFSGSDVRKIAVYNTASGHAMLLKSELLDLALPFQEQVYYDWWLTVVAACNGGVQYCPEVLVYQRWHGQNASGQVPQNGRQRHQQEKQMIWHNLARFRKAPGMDTAQQAFFEKAHQLWQEALTQKQALSLFLFLMRYRKTIFFSKNRKAAFFSHLKRSFRYAFR